MNAPGAVAVLGTGRMGGAMAAAFLAAGHRTAVWNRSPGRTGLLVAAGAAPAESPATAAATAPLVVLCVTDDRAARGVLAEAGPALDGRTVVNATTSTPDQARDAAEWVTARGAAYLSAPVMADCRAMGRPETHILYAGPRAAFDRHETTLHALGGAARYVGSDPGRAPLFELAMTGLFFEFWTGYLHVLALMRHEGVAAGEFAPVAERTAAEIPRLLPLIAHQIDTGDYDPAAYGGVGDQAELVDLVIGLRRTRGIDTTRLDHLRALMARGIAEGNGERGMSSLIETVETVETGETGEKPRAAASGDRTS